MSPSARVHRAVGVDHGEGAAVEGLDDAAAKRFDQDGVGCHGRTVARGARGAENAPMPLTALALVLCAALLHALWNIAAKKAGGGDAFMLMGALMIGVLWAPLALWFGLARAARAGAAREWGFVLGTDAGAPGSTTAPCCTGYREADLTVVYPVARGTGPLITVRRGGACCSASR